MYVGWVVNLDQDAAHIPSRPQRQKAFVEKSAEARRSSTTYVIIRFALRLNYTDHLISGCLAIFRAAGDRQRVYLSGKGDFVWSAVHPAPLHARSVNIYERSAILAASGSQICIIFRNTGKLELMGLKNKRERKSYCQLKGCRTSWGNAFTDTL